MKRDHILTVTAYYFALNNTDFYQKVESLFKTTKINRTKK